MFSQIGLENLEKIEYLARWAGIHNGRRTATMARPITVFKVWTILLSVVFGLLLFPNIVDKHGLWLSLFFTVAGIGVIWLAYFGIGQFINWAVSKEIKRRNLNREQKKHIETPDTDNC
jgi:hypothetical protein